MTTRHTYCPCLAGRSPALRALAARIGLRLPAGFCIDAHPTRGGIEVSIERDGRRSETVMVAGDTPGWIARDLLTDWAVGG